MSDMKLSELLEATHLPEPFAKFQADLVKRAQRLEEVKAAYILHREELDYVSDQKQKYNTVNRNVMTKTVRRFVYDMEVALRGDPVVYRADKEGDK